MTLEKALEAYEITFGKPYPLMITSEKSDKEIIDDIIECITLNIPAPDFEYEPDCDY